MIYPKQFEEKIEFDRIRELIKSHCLFEPGQERVDANDLRTISYELGINFDRLRTGSKETTVDDFLRKVEQYGRSDALKTNLQKRYPTARPDPEPQPQSTPTSPPPAAATKQTTLLQFLNHHFNMDDLQELAFELNVEFENLAGSTKRAKARALVARMVQTLSLIHI